MSQMRNPLCHAAPYEMYSNPPVLFDPSLLLRPSEKPVLADAIWALLTPNLIRIIGQDQYVLDGGELGQRIQWAHGSTYNYICMLCTEYVTRYVGIWRGNCCVWWLYGHTHKGHDTSEMSRWKDCRHRDFWRGHACYNEERRVPQTLVQKASAHHHGNICLEHQGSQTAAGSKCVH